MPLALGLILLLNSQRLGALAGVEAAVAAAAATAALLRARCLTSMEQHHRADTRAEPVMQCM